MSKKTDDLNESESGILTLCAVSGCCPTVDFTDPNEVLLRDDHGGMVRLTRAEWQFLKQTVKKFD